MKSRPYLSYLSYAVGVVLILAGLSTWPNMHTELMLLGGSFFAPLAIKKDGQK